MLWIWIADGDGVVCGWTPAKGKHTGHSGEGGKRRQAGADTRWWQLRTWPLQIGELLDNRNNSGSLGCTGGNAHGIGHDKNGAPWRAKGVKVYRESGTFTAVILGFPVA